ncbi:MAG: sigma 54-interacting transcriptional regulator, partial [Myxococcales bacterium]|nr:sigma 54-interacting transcriptional regulator [Myxococcales bacterium]
HLRGRAAAARAAFASAAEAASREGSLVEEATYLVGLAAAAADLGDVASALPAATRAALLWERLGQPARAARAWLARASALVTVGASSEAEVAAGLSRALARQAADVACDVYAAWCLAEALPEGDPRARDLVVAAHRRATELGDEDRVRSVARLVTHAPDVAEAERASVDACMEHASPTARWELVGARAARLAATGDATGEGPAVVRALLRLLAEPAPVGARGPALDAGARLARALGDGEAARRLERARGEAAAALVASAPREHAATLGRVAWARASEETADGGFSSDQVAQLGRIVRSLSERERLRPLFEQVLDALVFWAGVERGLLLLAAPGDRLVVRAARNLGRGDLAGEQLALSTSIAARARDERRPVIATDALAQVGDWQASVHALGLRSVLAVPLVARGECLGVVYLDDRARRGAFGPRELAWVEVVASQAASAIADARDQALLRRAVRKAERARARLARALEANAAELETTKQRLSLARSRGETRHEYAAIAGRSAAMVEMLRTVDRVTSSDVPVLLRGESGTGKELVARAIHDNGPRARRAFVAENCASIPEPLFESILFGHRRGAFTGAHASRVGLFDLADGGTLLLDEIGEMPAAVQAKLLRVLQEGEVRPVGAEREHSVDVRVIAATHRDLAEMVREGRFREDLFYRLSVVPITVPALRDRAEDIPELVATFTRKYAPEREVVVTRAAMDRLVACPWPGNVRQLENEIRRALVLAEGSIDVADLSSEVRSGAPSGAPPPRLALRERVDALEAQLVREALDQTRGNQTRAAELLGLSRFGLQKMMKRLGV